MKVQGQVSSVGNTPADPRNKCLQIRYGELRESMASFVFGSERLTGALLDRLTHHVHILEMNGDSFRLADSKRRSRRTRSEPPSDGAAQE